MGSANSAPSLSPAIHLTTALARSRPGSISHTREPTSNWTSSATAMKPLSEILSTRASTPLAPNSRILASSATGTREKRRRSLSSSAMRALIVTKLISTRGLLQRSRERQADAAILHPPHLCRDEALVKQVQGQPFADIGGVREDHHRAGRGDVDQARDVLAPAKLEHGGARQGRVAKLRALVDRAFFGARDHPAVEEISGRHVQFAPTKLTRP